MKRVACIFLSLILLLSVMVGAAPASAEEGDSLGKLVQLRGQYATVLGASNGIIVCGKYIGDTLYYGVVDYSGRVLMNFNYGGALAPDEYGNFVLYQIGEDGSMTSLVYDNTCSLLYTCDTVANNSGVITVSEGIIETVAVQVISETDGSYGVIYTYIDLKDSSHVQSVSTAAYDYYPTGAAVSEGYAVVCQQNQVTVVSMERDSVPLSVSIDASGNQMYASLAKGGYCVISCINDDGLVGAYLLNVKTLEVTALDTDIVNKMYCQYTSSFYAITLNYGVTGLMYNEDSSKMGFTALPSLQEPTAYYDAITVGEQKVDDIKYWTIYNNDRWFYIDSDGQTYGDYLDASDFANHLAAVTGDDGLTTVVDDNFTALTQPRDIGGVVVNVGDGIFCDVSTAEAYYLYAYSTDPNARMLGDITGDDQSTVSDVVELRDMIMSGSFTDQEKGYCDVDVDGAVTVSDVVELRDLIMAG